MSLRSIFTLVISFLALTSSAYAARGSSTGDTINVNIDLENSNISFTSREFTNPNRRTYYMNIQSLDENIGSIQYRLGNDGYGSRRTMLIQEAIFNERVIGTKLITLVSNGYATPNVSTQKSINDNQDQDQDQIINELRDEVAYQRMIISALASNRCDVNTDQSGRRLSNIIDFGVDALEAGKGRSR